MVFMADTPQPAPTPSTPRSFATLLDRSYSRAEFLQHLKALIATAQERIRQEHEGGMRGRNVVRHLTALVDDVVRTIFDFCLQQQGMTQPQCTVLALGGYGRGELNPYSDIDLMFLCHKEPPDTLIRETLYLLWDVGYTLGHSVRSRRDAIKIAHQDLSTQTAMLEARYIEGDQALFQWFQDEIGRRRFTQRRRQSFVRQKAEECRQRHAAFAHTVNQMEPNIKEGPGGLRDYHHALWLGMAAYEAGSIERLEDCGLLRSVDRQEVDEALDFLFRARNALHYHSGRKNDLLSVDVQEKIAAELGFEPDAQKLAVEHFLKTYYVHANAIHDVCMIVLEAATHGPSPQLWGVFSFKRPKPVEAGFVIIDGYLSHTDEMIEAQFAANPLLLLQAFVIADNHQAKLSPDLSRTIRNQSSLLSTESMRRSPEVKKLFFRLLGQQYAAPALRALHRHGILEAYIPEFAPLTCLAQYDLYHRYTVEEHTFHSIEALESLAHTTDTSMRTLSEIYKRLTSADKALLTLALVLHDLGKDVGPGHASHVYRSGELSTPICERLGLSETENQLIQVLVVNHLVMNHLAQRRDITDIKVISDFADMVGDVTHLEQLYLLTFADTSGVGPGVWTAWKGALLSELYYGTRAYLVRQIDDTAPCDHELRDRLKPQIIAAMGDHAAAVYVDAFLDSIPARYLRLTSPQQIAKHIGLTQPHLPAPIVLYTEADPEKKATLVTICGEERRGLFSMIAGTLSRHNLNILGAQIYTSKAGIAIDTLQVETLDHHAVTDQQMWDKLESELRAAVAGELSLDAVSNAPHHLAHTRQFRTFVEPPHVTLDNTSSDSYTVIEVKAQDSLGLLYNLTRVMYEHGLDIALAKISTEANRAIDVFYVTDNEGRKLLDEARQAAVQTTFLAALE
jgi:[protein-PII] uridylyltransferase